MTLSNLLDFTGDASWDGKYELVWCKKALSPSKLPEIDHALNPYGGCEHGCVYCYAPELTYTEWDDWKTVRVKMGIEGRLGKELKVIKGTIGIGTTTDPYQPAEKRFELTRMCLTKLKDKDLSVHLHTKSDLILRDIPLLLGMRGDVGITITSLDSDVSKVIEPGAPPPDRRVRALRELTRAGVNSYALVGPVLSVLEGHENEFAEMVASTNTKRMCLDGLNHRPMLSGRMRTLGIRDSETAKEKIRNLALSNGMDVFDVF